MTTTELPGQLALTFGETMSDRFEKFHRDNPRVYATLVRLAREWIASTGRRKIGIATLYERVRWEIAITTKRSRLQNQRPLQGVLRPPDHAPRTRTRRPVRPPRIRSRRLDPRRLHQAGVMISHHPCPKCGRLLAPVQGKFPSHRVPPPRPRSVSHVYGSTPLTGRDALWCPGGQA